MGLHTNVCNPILYYINMQVLWRGLPFAAKCRAKCTKMQCKMHQNAVRNALKRSAKCTKTQCEMHQNAMQNAPKRRVIWGKWRAQVHINALELERFIMTFD